MGPADELHRRSLEARRAQLAARLDQAREVARGAWQRSREAAHTGDGPAQTKWGTIAAQFEATAHAISGALQALDDELRDGERDAALD